MRPTNRWPGTTIRLPPPCPLHEPPPLPPFGHPLPRGGGEGRGEGAVGWFKGARRAQSSGRSSHEPTHPWPLPGGELGKRAPTWTPLLRRGWGWVHRPTACAKTRGG